MKRKLVIDFNPTRLEEQLRRMRQRNTLRLELARLKHPSDLVDELNKQELIRRLEEEEARDALFMKRAHSLDSQVKPYNKPTTW